MAEDPQHEAHRAELSEAKRALLERWLEGRRASAPGSEPARRGAGLMDLPLSFAQERMWFLHQLEPGSPLYNIATAIRLRDLVNAAALEQSVNEVVRRHEVLRTSFEVRCGEPFQVIAPSVRILLPVRDLSDLPARERTVELRRFVREEVRRPFDLAVGPLLRTVLLRLAPDEHILLVTTHHIAADGWSIHVFCRELSVLYAAFAAGAPPALEELPIQYADFAVWQRRWKQGDALESQLTYWRKQLEGAPPALDLPTDRPRPAVPRADGASQWLTLPRELSIELGELSRGREATLFMTLLAAFKALLHRLSGQDDIVVGTPVAGRTQRNTEGLIGCFLNTLVLRTRLSAELTFEDLLERVRQTALGAYAHQDIPFEKLLEELQPERSPGRTPLFQVFFNMLNYAEPTLDMPGATLLDSASDEPEEALARFDLTVYVEDSASGVRINAVYRTDLFGHHRICELLRQYELVLQQVVERPQEKLLRLSLVTPWARTALPDPFEALDVRHGLPVHAAFSRRARRAPDRIAVVDQGESWTYEELDALSSRLASVLRAQGIRSGDVVAILGQRSASLVWALLGVLKAGAAFLILDPEYPSARLAECVRTARPRGWIEFETGVKPSAELSARLDELAPAARLVLPRRAACEPLVREPLTLEEPSERPGAGIGGEDLAYVAFTSGTTGRPRGILGTHGPLSHFIEWHTRTFRLDELDRFSMLSGLSHDPLLRDIFTPLVLGATLYVPSAKEMASGSAAGLAKWIARERISVIHLSPSVGRMLMESAAALGALGNDGAVFPSLRYLFFGGDSLTWALTAGLDRYAPDATLVNFYGTTETPQAMAWHLVDRSRDGLGGQGVVPLGRGIAGAQLVIQSAPGVLAGIGELGEICVRSPYLSTGYLGDEALSERAFCANLFGARPGDRLFRTGDLGRYLPGGDVAFVGRRDDQVKVRGSRVELGEVQGVLQLHPAVMQAAVAAHMTPDDEKHLVAYVVACHGETLTASDLHQFVRERLPEYMVPSALVMLDQLPLTPNGKVDRRALPAPDGTRPRMKGAYVSPRTDVERVLARIWSGVLGIEHVGIHDDFFELGGHSLLALRLVHRVLTTLEVEVPLRAVFEAPTVAGLAQVVQQPRDRRRRSLPPIERISRERHRFRPGAGGSDRAEDR